MQAQIFDWKELEHFGTSSVVLCRTIHQLIHTDIKYIPKNRILRAHLRSHQHIWSCPEEGCLQTLPTFTALSAHMRYSHSDVREFGPCPFCQKKFKSRNDYRYDLFDVSVLSHSDFCPITCYYSGHTSKHIENEMLWFNAQCASFRLFHKVNSTITKECNMPQITPQS